MTVKGSTPLKQKQQPLQNKHSESENGSQSSEKQFSDAKEVDKENGEVLKETIDSPGARREERDLDIPPGERLSIAVGCQAK